MIWSASHCTGRPPRTAASTMWVTPALIISSIRARVAAQDFPGRKITLSIGIGEFPEHGQTGEEVISAADEALYAAKRAGRNRVVRSGEQSGKVKGKA